MYLNKIFQFFNVLLPLAFSVRPDGMGIKYMAGDFFSMHASPFYHHSKTLSFMLTIGIRIFPGTHQPGQYTFTSVLGNTITANPENVEYMLKTRFDTYSKGRPFSIILNDPIGCGIFNVNDDSWRFQWKIVSLEFDSVSIEVFLYRIFPCGIYSPCVTDGRLETKIFSKKELKTSRFVGARCT
jgi:hypothetical protein